MTITTTIVLRGMLDAIHLLDHEVVLERVDSGLRFMLEECGVAALPEGDSIFFGPGDTRLILNVSVAAAGLFARVGTLLKREDLIAQASRAARLVTHHQNGDGSWYYSPAHGDHPLDTIIDSRHTGYIIEGLASVNAVAPDPVLASAIARGWHYARTRLTEEGKPRWSPEQTWPVDSHDVAQGAMTALTCGDVELARQHVSFAMDRLYSGNGIFRYKAFESGKANDAVFIRWTQAPMYKAMARYLAVQPHEPHRT